MSHVEAWEDDAADSAVGSVPVSRLGVTSSYRAGGLDAEQVERLAALEGAWPPILVRRADHSVIDGAHRVAAARRLGMARVEVTWFDGSAGDAFVEFVRRNVAHGLTLSLQDRKRAAQRILGEHPRWSDRRVAELCALSPKTVGRVRREAGCPTGEDPQSDGEVREGRDHRLRPVRGGSARARVLEALRDQPDGSLRAIAAVAGTSPETVRLVRLNLADGGVGMADADVGGDEVAPPAGGWQGDAALATADTGDRLVDWLDRTAVTDADVAWAGAVPLSRVYVVADEARRRSAAWLEIARAVEARANRSR